EHRPDLLAAALTADELWHQIHRQRTELPAELAGKLLQVDILAVIAVEAGAANPQPGIDHRANRRVSRWIKLLGHSETTLPPDRHPDRLHLDQAPDPDLADIRAGDEDAFC